jgi:hypothetical protein
LLIYISAGKADAGTLWGLNMMPNLLPSGGFSISEDASLAERPNKKLLKIEETFIHSAWTRLSKG